MFAGLKPCWSRRWIPRCPLFPWRRGFVRWAGHPRGMSGPMVPVRACPKAAARESVSVAWFWRPRPNLTVTVAVRVGERWLDEKTDRIEPARFDDAFIDRGNESLTLERAGRSAAAPDGAAAAVRPRRDVIVEKNGVRCSHAERVWRGDVLVICLESGTDDDLRPHLCRTAAVHRRGCGLRREASSWRHENDSVGSLVAPARRECVRGCRAERANAIRSRRQGWNGDTAAGQSRGPSGRFHRSTRP